MDLNEFMVVVLTVLLMYFKRHAQLVIHSFCVLS